jgi:hypothetical protein
VILTAVLRVPTEGLVYLEGGTETAFRKAPKVGVEYAVPRLYRFYFKYTFSSIPSHSFFYGATYHLFASSPLDKERRTLHTEGPPGA